MRKNSCGDPHSLPIPKLHSSRRERNLEFSTSPMSLSCFFVSLFLLLLVPYLLTDLSLEGRQTTRAGWNFRSRTGRLREKNNRVCGDRNWHGQPFVRRGCLTRGLTRLFSEAGRDGCRAVFGMGRLDKEFMGHCWLVKDGEPFLETETPQTRYAEMYRISPTGSRTLRLPGQTIRETVELMSQDRANAKLLLSRFTTASTLFSSDRRGVRQPLPPSSF